jgi:hypothetical protein
LAAPAFSADDPRNHWMVPVKNAPLTQPLVSKVMLPSSSGGARFAPAPVPFSDPHPALGTDQVIPVPLAAPVILKVESSTETVPESELPFWVSVMIEAILSPEVNQSPRQVPPTCTIWGCSVGL